jgi:hypothetical protein
MANLDIVAGPLWKKFAAANPRSSYAQLKTMLRFVRSRGNGFSSQRMQYVKRFEVGVAA